LSPIHWPAAATEEDTPVENLHRGAVVPRRRWGMRRMILALVLLSLPVGTLAGTHRAGAGGGAGGREGSLLAGLQLNAEYVLRNAGATNSYGERQRTLSLVGDFTLLSGKHDGLASTQYTLVGGLRGTLNRRVQPFAHVMGGRYWEVQTGESAWAWVGGIGVDWPLGRERLQASASPQPQQHVHAEPSVTTVLRAQLDYYAITSEPKSYPQLTFLFVLRFH
jgi:hypothetical protein